MKLPTICLALASVSLVTAQLGGGPGNGGPGHGGPPTKNQGPIGGQCAALGPHYYSAVS